MPTVSRLNFIISHWNSQRFPITCRKSTHHLYPDKPGSKNSQKVRHPYSRLWSFAFPLGSNCLQCYPAILVKPRSIRATETFLNMVNSRTSDAGISITGPDNIWSYSTWIEAWSSIQTRFSESPLKTLFRQVGTNELSNNRVTRPL